MSSLVLVLNCGSSSAKFALIDPATARRRVTGLAERVGTTAVSVVVTTDGRSRRLPGVSDPSHRGVICRVMDELTAWLSSQKLFLTAVGHRIAHGGEAFSGPAVLDDAAVEQIRDLGPMAPMHNPAQVMGIQAARELLPQVPHVGVFDTAFHHAIPARASHYAVPREWYRDHGVRRYGFHGTSHSYVSAEAARLLGRNLTTLRLVTAHLGNGCSVTAVRAGRSVDTSMGLTPMEGLVMGTRSGDLDPGVHGYLADRAGLSLAQVTDDLNRRSGLLGLSGVSNDMREVQAAAAAGNPDAALALEVFVYRLAKYVAAFLVPLGGVDAVVFTGGIGENSPPIRAAVIDSLGFLGWRLDEAANTRTVDGVAGVVAVGDRPGSPVGLVVPTDEELVIATEAFRLAQQDPPVGSPVGAALGGRTDTRDHPRDTRPEQESLR
ncbi:MAG TPA: acetate kinase [Dermatophilaceae bacterium]|nr:acetate kinase [Dermatophilaceae bacterium]